MIVYKKTLTISIIMCSILAFLSITLSFWNDNQWISFIINWCVGIACSLFVVIITTYIQFKAENHKITIKLAAESLVWLKAFYELQKLLDKSKNLNEIAKGEEFQKIMSNYIERYTETTYKCFALSSEYVSFSKKTAKTNQKLNNTFAMVYQLCTSKEYVEKPLKLIQKLKFTINAMQFLKDLELFLKPNHLYYVKERLNKLSEKNNESQAD